MRGRRIAALLVTALGAVPVLAQPGSKPATESVTVTGTKDRQAIEGFVQSLATPTRAAAKLARWQLGICPLAFGLKPSYLKFIIQHLKDVAAKVGAPINNRLPCENNIVILFTATPQALADNIKRKSPALLGYYDNQDQLTKLATVTHPIQAWYMTETQDAHGQVTIDTAKVSGEGLIFEVPCGMIGQVGALCPIFEPSAHTAAATDSHLGDGLRSGLYNVVIVVDPAKLSEYEIGSLADYIAMLALAQIVLPDSCQQLPSVLNMLAKACPQKSSALTDNDLAYLKGLYKMGPDRLERMQKDEIAYQMQQSLTGH